MVSLTLIAVGLLVATAGVVALARGSTARWEQDRRAKAAARADVCAGETSEAGFAVRKPSAMTRRVVAALRSRTSRLAPGKALVQLMPTGLRQVTSPVRPLRRLVGALPSSLFGGKLPRGRWTKRRSPALPVDEDGADTALTAPPSPAATDLRRDGVPGATRRALGFLHRRADRRDARIQRKESDESPTAG
jgi:hypothetical protein